MTTIKPFINAKATMKEYTAHNKAAASCFLNWCQSPVTPFTSCSACGDIKVQVVLQLGVSRGRSEVLLSGYGRLYPSEIVSEFGPLR